MFDIIVVTEDGVKSVVVEAHPLETCGSIARKAAVKFGFKVGQYSPFTLQRMDAKAGFIPGKRSLAAIGVHGEATFRLYQVK